MDVSSLHYVYLWFFWGIFRSGTWNFPKNFLGSVLNPARGSHQRKPKNVGFLISYICAYVKKIFQSDIAYNAYIIISHICADYSAPALAAAGHHMEQKSPFAHSIYRKIRKIKLHITKKEPFTMDKIGKRFSIEREKTMTIGKRLRTTTSVVCAHIIPENCQNQQGRNFNDFFLSRHIQYN